MSNVLLKNGFKEIDHELFSKANTPYQIFAEVLDDDTQKQFFNVINLPYVKQGALMPDAHSGYTMPIGGVCATEGHIVPQFVGFDIGCGVAALKTPFSKNEIIGLEDEILYGIQKEVPVGFSKFSEPQDVSGIPGEITDISKKFLKDVGVYQLGTLGGGNHFIEIGFDENDSIWIVVHSGSRGLGHKIASHYMTLSYMNSLGDFDEKPIIERVKKERADVLKHNPEAFDRILDREISKAKFEFAKSPNLDNLDGIYSLEVDSEDGQNYIKDLNFALNFALENRKRMIQSVFTVMFSSLNPSSSKEDMDPIDWTGLINRNHNHAEFHEESSLWIHRKGATHAENGMLGVIPGNMRDGSFVVKGKGNKLSLNSSSHGAGRVMSRVKAKNTISIDDFKSSMEGITGFVDEAHLDESPFAYKNIFEVMKLQEDLVDVIAHIKPLINVKG